MRLIDADKIDFNEVFKGQSDFARDTREAAKSLIDAQSTVYKWIPIAEKLPNEPKRDVEIKEYNVTIFGSMECTTLAYIGQGEWHDENENRYNVIAWMPLPESYRPD